MSILAPFHMAFPTLPLPPAAPEPLPPPLPVSTASKHPLEDLSEGESEMESSEEKVAEKSSVFDASRVASTSRRKCLKKEAIVGPAINKEITHEEADWSKELKAEQKDDVEARGEEVLEKEKSNVESFATAGGSCQWRKFSLFLSLRY
ncbi:hypothetical protein SAY86_028013 [Trapa natans]|uniref:Uncharacterized protein n=1 Tax=Trapa natans TaxID=22666 RepID=A0AAN7M0B1_TRANT|nr:hypothetical protein SAY86_028013 [Trapa natans]